MLHTKPQGHWPFGSGEEDFWRVFTIYGRGGHFFHVTQTPRTNFRSPIPLRLHMKFGFDRPSGFGEEDLWKWWTDNGRTDGRTDDGPWLYYKHTNEPKGSGELKIKLHGFESHARHVKLEWICKHESANEGLRLKQIYVLSIQDGCSEITYVIYHIQIPNERSERLKIPVILWLLFSFFSPKVGIIGLIVKFYKAFSQ